MKWLLWSAGVFVGYAYLGYPAWLWILSKSVWRQVRRAPYSDPISIVMVVRNEGAILERKLAALLQLDFPIELTEVIVVSDGSSDGTNDVLAQFAGRVRAIFHPLFRGKAAGINDAVRAARGNVIVFVDARQEIEPRAISQLLENFADPTVGCVSGELMLGSFGARESTSGLGFYWRVEKKIRELESASGSVIGATGAFYAVRRHLIVNVPEGTILDDVFIPMNVLRLGFRVVFDSRARAWDVPNQGLEKEFSRKVRTLSGNYQLLQLAPWLLSRANPALFRFVSHKVSRLLVPFALLILLISSSLVSGSVYRATLILQLTFYGLSLCGIAKLIKGPLARLADAAATFLLLNSAALVAFANFVSGRKVAWSQRGDECPGSG